MSAITPSRKGRIAWILSGVLPIINLASLPTTLTRRMPSRVSSATTDGSLSTMPLSRTYTTVFTVPRSIAILCAAGANRLKNFIYGANAFGNEWNHQARLARQRAPRLPFDRCGEGAGTSTKGGGNTARTGVSQARLIDRV